MSARSKQRQKIKTRRDEDLVKIEMGQDVENEKYELEIVAQKRFWPEAAEKMYITVTKYTGAGGYVRRTFTFDFRPSFEPDVGVEIEVMQTRYNASGTGRDFWIKFALPPGGEGTAWPFLTFFDRIASGEINENNLADEIKKFFKDLREHVSELAEHISP